MYTQPLKHSEKYDFDGLIELKIEHKVKKVVTKTLQPSKSYVRVKKEEKQK